MELRILSAEEIKQALPMVEAIEAMKVAYEQLSTGQAEMPLRGRVTIPDRGDTLVMPAYLLNSQDLAVKVVSVFPRNSDQGQPIISALVLVLDANSGRPLGILEGSSLTAIRTGAGAGAATDLLARPLARTVALFGSGVQARTLLEAVCTVRPIETVLLYSRNTAHAETFATEMAGYGPIPANIRLVSHPDEAIADADIICTATTASQPVFDGANIRPGTHINAIGSYLPSMQEVDTATIQRALVVVDSRTAVLAETGDLLIPIATGHITPDHIHAEIGQILAGHKQGRTSDEQITYFKSVGVAVQDAAAGRIALQNALSQHLGQLIQLF